MKRILPLLFCLGVVATPALADPLPDEPTLVAQADLASAPTPPTESAPVAEPATPSATSEQPSDALHDPLSNPVAAFDDIKAAKRIGWGVAFLVCVIMLCGILGKAGGVFKPLGTPRVMFAIGSVSTFAATAYNAVYLGGAWVAALAAAGPPLIAAMVKVWQWEPAKQEAATQ